MISHSMMFGKGKSASALEHSENMTASGLPMNL